jgi:hypothetical protein
MAREMGRSAGKEPKGEVGLLAGHIEEGRKEREEEGRPGWA